MNQEEANELLKRKDLSPEEEQLLESWMLQYRADELPDFSEQFIESSHNRTWAKVSHQIWPPQKAGRLWPAIGGIAAAVALITLGVWFYNHPMIVKPEANSSNLKQYADDIKPGKQGATLTLANGRRIRLTEATNGELAKEAGVIIRKTTDGQLIYEIKTSEGKNPDPEAVNTLSTAKGETYQVRLPDGSKVWLNAASSITYAANLLNQGKRKVRLSGEGYFEIAKDKNHPFVVESEGQVVEVLGTHFNINSYQDEKHIKTTLIEGLLRVSPLQNGSADIGAGALLHPDQQSVFSRDQSIIVKSIDAMEAIDWKNGLFIFNKEPLERIMRKISRWYDVEVVFENDQLKGKLFGGTVSRFYTVNKVLEVLELTELAHFRIEGRRIMVTK